jgi:serine acetyltransferase
MSAYYKKIMRNFFSELKLNRRNKKGFLIVAFFRLSQFFGKNLFLKIVGLPVRISYKILVDYLMGTEIPENTKVGFGLQIYHGQGLVVVDSTVIGEYVTLRHNTTIGNAHSGGKGPVIGNHVKVGANSVILGNIHIGDNVVIGAGSVVVKDVPANTVVAGNPARIIKTIQ